MRHRKHGKKLGMPTGHRKAVIRNLLTSLIIHERIETTHAKCKVLKREFDKLITLGKKNTLHARRLAAGRLYGKEALKKLFEELAPRFEHRNGGYCRIIPVGPRRGDAAFMSIIEVISAEEEEQRLKQLKPKTESEEKSEESK